MKGVDLKIDVIENKQALSHPLVAHSVLPQHEFSMIIVAPKGSGKTNFICNLILKHYKEYFHKIWVCSPTVNNDEKWDVVKATKKVLKRNTKLEHMLNGQKVKKNVPKIVFDNAEKQMKHKKDKKDWDGKIPKEDFFPYMDELFPRLAEQQKVIDELRGKDEENGGKAKFNADRLLIVLDDQAGMFKGGNNNNPIVNYVIKHRHYSSSCIIVTQAYKAVPKTIRTNCNAVILFEIPNLQELKVVYEENPDGMNEKEWMATYRHCTAEPFSFMYINSKFKKGERVFRNFDTMIQVGKESIETTSTAKSSGRR